MAIVPQEKLDFWIKNNLNVEFIGEHGVGKTSIIKEAWERHGLRYLYFSAATMDPWIDLVGVPRERSIDVERDGKTVKVDYIDLVPPKPFALDEVDAIFFDEYNRAPEKVRNATMQLIQLKEINGRKYKNLRMIWTAINPPDTGKYDVQELDPAQRDRFHVSFFIPNRPDIEYFTQKYGEDGPKFVNWWSKLPADIQRNISPRRLDYGAQIYTLGGDMGDVFPPNTNTNELANVLSYGTIESRYQRLRNNPHTTEEDKRKFINNDNNFQHLKEIFAKKDDEAKETFRYFVKHFEPERVLAMCNDDVYMYDKFVDNAGIAPNIFEVLKGAPKAHILDNLQKGAVITNYGIKNQAENLEKETGQGDLLAEVHKIFRNGGDKDPNKIWGAAYALKNADRWASSKSLESYKALRKAVDAALAQHPEIKKHF